jgi:hypothetical protein
LREVNSLSLRKANTKFWASGGNVVLKVSPWERIYTQPAFTARRLVKWTFCSIRKRVVRRSSGE